MHFSLCKSYPASRVSCYLTRSMGDKSDVPFIESSTVSASPDKEEVLESELILEF